MATKNFIQQSLLSKSIIKSSLINIQVSTEEQKLNQIMKGNTSL